MSVTDKSTNSTPSLPHSSTQMNAFKLSIVEDKPIMLDYWKDSLDNQVIIGIRENNVKLLVKSEDEYTSPISKIYKVETDYIIMTENSIYIVSTNISTKKITN